MSRGGLEPWLNRFHCRESLQAMMEIPEESVDGLITDPPYSSGGMFRSDRVIEPSAKYQTHGTMRSYPSLDGDNRDQRGYAFWAVLWLLVGYRLLKEGGIVALFSDWRQLPVTSDVLQAAGFIWRGIGVWDKTEAARPEKGRYRNQCEYLVWGTKGPAPKEGSCLPGVWRKAVNASEKYHINGKPLEVMRQICTIVPPGGVIVDPFAGSGMTCIGARLMGRHFIGIDQNPVCCHVANERLRAETAQLNMFTGWEPGEVES